MKVIEFIEDRLEYFIRRTSFPFSSIKPYTGISPLLSETSMVPSPIIQMPSNLHSTIIFPVLSITPHFPFFISPF
jgi:hypothetical protein